MGDRRIGVALSDPEGILATPLTIIERTGSEIRAIVALVEQHKVGRVVVGLPYSMNGSLGQQAVKVQEFTAELAANIKVPMVFRDERLSTVSARRLLRAGRKTSRKAPWKTRDDAAAAALILQDFLDEGKARRESEADSSHY
ncbi:MAG: Holliday junction resolvase RuvX [Chloroflexi bacterium]|nr:Holliday junction resolvase RuvX [Chloroflexota bacterium]